MGVRTSLAKATGAILTWGLRNLARRPAGNVPGKIALYVDPRLIAGMRSKLREGSVVVVGTNGKTTVTNLIANVLEASGRSVICNRTGANLDSGIASALLQGAPSDWGILECDELWLAKVAPDLLPTYVVLLDLFRDQLDRCGEIDRIQESIIDALESTSDTTLVFNADDPLCAYVAEHCSNPKVAFGLAEGMGLDQNRVADATMCQNCLTMFDYEYRQYGQLGAFSCPNCGFARPELDFLARSIQFSAAGLSFDIAVHNCLPGIDESHTFQTGSSISDRPLEECSQGSEASDPFAEDLSVVDHKGDNDESFRITTHLTGTYMVYNILAVSAASLLCGCSPSDIQKAVSTFDPKNGRLQQYDVRGRHVLLNLAKNPTGFNQNLRIVEAEERPAGVAFFINDKIMDGFDISWIWDIDFEELAGHPDLHVFAGGTRKNDLQVRLKYAGIDADLIDSVGDAFDRMDALTAEGMLEASTPLYAIANYSAMPPVHEQLDAISEQESTGIKGPQDQTGKSPVQESTDPSTTGTSTSSGAFTPKGEEVGYSGYRDGSERKTPSSDDTPNLVSSHDCGEGSLTPIVIAHMLPDLLNLYGDGGNIRILEQRLKWRGIPVEVRRVEYGDPIDLGDVDLVFLGGGPDREQRLATEQLDSARDEFVSYIDDDGPVLAICGGYQILGRTWLYDGGEAPGLSILGMETRRPGTSADRIIGNFALDSSIAEIPVIGFENHAGRTYLDDGVEPFGRVVSKRKGGNNDAPGSVPADGVLQGRILGTYSHGVLLSKNPEVADWVLGNALARHAERTGEDIPDLASMPLDDTVELEANDFMAKKLL